MRKLFTLLPVIVCFNFIYAQEITAVGGGINGSYINDITFFNGELYAGGYFTPSGNPKDHVYKFNGSQWQPMAGGISGAQFPYINSFAEFDNKLFMCGTFTKTGTMTTTDLGAWSGTAWEDAGGGVERSHTLFTFKNNLYVSTIAILSAGGTKAFLWKWNGAQWQNIADSFVVEANPNFDIQGIHAVAEYKGKLIVAGLFKSINGLEVNNIAAWDGTNWSAVSGGTNGGIRALQVWNDTLYAGGRFSTAGTDQANNMAKWDGANWKGMDPGVDQGISAFGVYGAELWIGGQFFNPNRGVLTFDGKDYNTPFVPDGGVEKFLNDGNTLLFAGDFDKVNNQNMRLIGRYRKIGLGVDETQQLTLNVYPNPAGNFLNIAGMGNAGDATIEVYDASGKSMDVITSQNGNEIMVNTEGYAKGIYYLSVKAGNGYYSKTFVKE